MAKVTALPLSQFINPGALADQATIENVLPFLGGRLSGPINDPNTVVGTPTPRKLTAWSLMQPPRTPTTPGYFPAVDPSVAEPTYAGAALAEGWPFTQAGQPVAGSTGWPPQMNSSSDPGDFALKDMGELPPGPVYPHVQPGEQVGDTGATQSPQPPIQPAGPPQPWSYYPPQIPTAQQDNGPFSSDAGMWGLIAAGLGILANNTGNYGQAGPAIGRGGLIGVNTFLQQRQIAERQRLAEQELTQRNKLINAQVGNYESEVQKRNEEAQNLQALRGAYATILSGAGPDGAKLMSDPQTHFKVAATLLQAGNPTAARQAMQSGIDLQKEQKDKWKQIMLPQGENATLERPAMVSDTGETRPIQGAGTRPIFNPTSLVQVDARDTSGIKASIDVDKDRLKEWQAAADASSKGLIPVVRMEKALENASTYSGAMAPYQKGLANILSSVGIPVDTDRLASSEEYEAQMAQWVRNNIKALGSGTAISNVDLAFTQNSGPAMRNSLQGKKLILKAMRADMEWMQDAYSDMRKYWDSHNYSLSGWKPPEYKILKELDQQNRPSIDEVMSK